MPFALWKHTERNTDTETEKNMYYDFMRFGDSSIVRNILKQ